MPQDNRHRCRNGFHLSMNCCLMCRNGLKMSHNDCLMYRNCRQLYRNDCQRCNGLRHWTTDDSSETTDDSSETTDDSSETTDDSSETTDDSSETTDDSSETTDDCSVTTDDCSWTTDDCSVESNKYFCGLVAFPGRNRLSRRENLRCNSLSLHPELRSGLGSACVPPKPFVPPSVCWAGENNEPRSFRRDAENSTRDACAPR